MFFDGTLARLAFSVCLAVGLWPAQGLLAREPGDFSDLMEGEREVFGSEKELKYKVRAFPIFEWEQWENHSAKVAAFGLYKSTDYPKFTSLRVLPFYYGEQSKIDNRERYFYFPLIPIFHRVDGDEKVTWAPFYYHRYSSTESFKWFALYISNVNDTKADRAVIPFVYFGSSKARGSAYFTLFPLFSVQVADKDDAFKLITPLLYHSSDTQSAFSISPLHFYSSHAWAGKETELTSNASVTVGFPVIPFLFYRSREGTDSHVNVVTLLDFGFDKDGLDRFWVIPFAFYGRDRYFYSPFYLTATESKEDAGWFWHIPIALLFNWGTTPKHAAEIEESTHWQIPFFYRSKDAAGTHTNVALLFDWKSARTPDGGDTLTKFRVIPFFWYSSAPDRNDVSITTLLFYHARTDTTTFNISPLHFYSSETTASSPGGKAAKNARKDSVTLGLPIIPFLFYRSREGTESHVNILTLFDFGFDDKDGVARAWIWPLFFYERDRYSYSPFYMHAHVTPEDDSWFVHVPLALFFSWGKVPKSGAQVEDAVYWQIPFYYRSIDAGSTHTNVAVLFDWRTSRTPSGPGPLTRFMVLPFFYYFSEPDRNDYSVTMVPFFHHEADERSTFNFSLAHFYSSSRFPPRSVADTATGKNDSVKFGFPILPFVFYRSRTGSDSHVNVLTLFDFGFDKEGLDRVWIWPLAFYGRDRYIYSPFYLHKFETPEDDTWSWHVPILLFFNWGKVPKDAATADVVTRWQFPLFYYSRNNEGSHTNILGVVADVSRSNNELERLWTLVPPIFYKRDAYLHIVPFFFRAVGGEAPEGRSFGPLHYHSWSPEHRRLWLGLHYSSSFAKDEKGIWTDRVWHIVPFYISWFNKESQGTVVPLPLPYVHYEDATTDYTFLIAGSLRSTRGTVSISGGLTTKNEKHYIDLDVALFYNLFSYSSRFEPPFVDQSDKRFPKAKPVDETVEKEGPSLVKKITLSRDDSEFFQGFQFLYGILAFGTSDSKRHFRLLPLAWLTWDKSSDDRLKVVLPFYVSYQSDEFEYFVVAPFYGMQREKTTFMHSVLVFLFLYEYDTEKKSWEYTLVWPIANIHKSPEASGYRVLPIYWQKATHEKDAETFRSMSLLHYYSWRQEKNQEGKPPGTETTKWFAPIIPMVYDVVTKTGDATSRSTWITPLLTYYSNTRTVTSEETSVYAPLLYWSRSDARGSSRLLHFSPLHFYNSKSLVEEPRPDGVPGRRRLSYSFGVPILPILYYGSGDENSWMHVAPLALFFAWGTQPRTIERKGQKGEDGQRVVTSQAVPGESTFWQIPLFYRSVDATTTHTYIFPLIDWASEVPRSTPAGSPKVLTRFLVLPFAYYFAEPGQSESSLTVIPLFHRESSKTATFNFSLLHFYSSERPADAADKNAANRSATLGLPIVPFLFYRSRDGEDSHVNILTLFDFGFEKGALDRIWVIPFIFYSKNDYFYSPVYMASSANQQDDSWFKHVPLALYFSWGTVPRKSSEVEEATYWQFPLFYRSKDAAGTHTYVFPIFDWYSERDSGGSATLSRFMVLPVFYYFADPATSSSSTLFAPFFYHEKSDTATLNFSLLHFYSSSRANGVSENASSTIGFPILPLLYYRSREGTNSHVNVLALLDLGFDKEGLDRLWVLPLVFYGRDSYFYSPFFLKSTDRDEKESWYVHLPLPLSLWSWGDKHESTYMWWPILPVFYRNVQDTGTTHVNVLGLIDWKTDSLGLSRLLILNTYYEADRVAKETSFHFMPLYFSWKAEDRTSLWIAGLYMHWSQDYNRQNFLYLYDHQSFLRANVATTRFLFGAVSYETSPNETQFSVLWRALGGYHGWNGSNKYNMNVLWYIQARDGNEFHSSFLPVWWYSKWDTGYRLIIPPLLTYSAEDEDGIFTAVALGAAYYRNYDARQRTDSQYVGAGSIYRYYSTPERGYSTRGSLWGLLWEHEHESETGYDKFWVLKIVYSNTRVEGRQIRRILGVSID